MIYILYYTIIITVITYNYWGLYIITIYILSIIIILFLHYIYVYCEWLAAPSKETPADPVSSTNPAVASLF